MSNLACGFSSGRMDPEVNVMPPGDNAAPRRLAPDMGRRLHALVQQRDAKRDLLVRTMVELDTITQDIEDCLDSSPKAARADLMSRITPPFAVGP